MKALRCQVSNTKKLVVQLTLCLVPLGYAQAFAQVPPEDLNSQLLSLPVVDEVATQIRALIERGADVNARDKEGETMLFRAAREGDADVVKLLLEKGADVNARNGEGYPAIALGGAMQLFCVVKLLLEKGADANAKAPGNEEPLGFAIMAVKPKKMLKELRRQGYCWNTEQIPTLLPTWGALV